MLFAIDVDQTVAGSNAYEIYAHFHNQDLDLRIDPEILKQLKSYRDFFFLPQVVAFRQANEHEWNASRHRAIATPWVIEAFSPLEGAVQGVAHLSAYGQIRYYTARTPLVREATQRWLGQHMFKQSQEVICCSSIEQKIRALACYEPQNEQIVLIDDRGHSHFLDMLERMKNDVEGLCSRLRILAFGASACTLPQTTLVPLIALPSWGQLHCVLRSSIING